MRVKDLDRNKYSTSQWTQTAQKSVIAVRNTSEVYVSWLVPYKWVWSTRCGARSLLLLNMDAVYVIRTQIMESSLMFVLISFALC